jgi:hypothetical protein
MLLQLRQSHSNSPFHSIEAAIPNRITGKLELRFVGCNDTGIPTCARDKRVRNTGSLGGDAWWR